MLDMLLKAILLLGIPITHLIVILMIRHGTTPKNASLVFAVGLTLTIVGSLAFVAFKQEISTYTLVYLTVVGVMLLGIGYGVGLLMFKIIINRWQQRVRLSSKTRDKRD